MRRHQPPQHRPAVRRQREVADQPSLLNFARGVQNTRRDGLVPQTQEQNVRGVHLQLAQSTLETPSDESGNPRIGLYDQNQAIALRAQIADRLSESSTAPAAPV